MEQPLPDHARGEASQLEVLRARGFDVDYVVLDDGLHLVGAGAVDPHDVHIDAQYRFEGASDPDDEAVVLGLHDPVTGTRGVLVSAYGPAASAAEAEVLSVLSGNPSCT
jgi:hypothetical protein